MEEFLNALSSTQLLAQLFGIAVVLTLALLAGPAARRFSLRGAQSYLPWQREITEGLLRIMPALSALVLLVVLRAAYAGAGMATGALELTMQLALGLVLVRGAVMPAMNLAVASLVSGRMPRQFK